MSSPKGMVYLCGSMEFSKDNGEGWRRIATIQLRKYGYEPVDPTVRQPALPSSLEINSSAELKKQNLPAYIEHIRNCIDIDLKYIKDSEAVLLRIDKGIGGGSLGEATFAYYTASVPIFAFKDPDVSLVEDTSGWLISCCSRIDHTMEEAISHMNEYLDIRKTVAKGK